MWVFAPRLSDVCVKSLKFVGLPVREILGIYCMSINRPGDLDLWPWNWCALLPVAWATLLPILVFLGRFVLDLSANTCQTRHVPILPSVGFVGLPVRKILGIYCVGINRPVTLNFDILTSKWVHGLHVWWAFILPNLVFPGLSVLELCRGTRQTDEQTDRHTDTLNL